MRLVLAVWTPQKILYDMKHVSKCSEFGTFELPQAVSVV
jgi:hypothetical protein